MIRASSDVALSPQTVIKLIKLLSSDICGGLEPGIATALILCSDVHNIYLIIHDDNSNRSD
jgi:hypothetical protein